MAKSKLPELIIAFDLENTWNPKIQESKRSQNIIFLAKQQYLMTVYDQAVETIKTEIEFL